MHKVHRKNVRETNDEVLFFLKPSIGNAIIPLVIRRFWHNLAVFAILLFVSVSLAFYELLAYSVGEIIFIDVLIIILYICIGLIWKLIVLGNTNYRFYKDYLSSDFKFFSIERKIVPYQRITNITIRMSLWDRLCKAGDVTIHTADEEQKNLVLEYLPEPQGVQMKIMKMIRK